MENLLRSLDLQNLIQIELKEHLKLIREETRFLKKVKRRENFMTKMEIEWTKKDT